MRVAMVQLNRATLAVAAALLIFSGCGGESAPQPGVESVAEQRAAGRAESLYSRVIPPSDLPPEGTRSLLDYWIAEQGSIPFPFDEFMARLGAEDAAGRIPLAVLLPDGRSLLKAQADFSQPRIIVAANMRPPSGGAQLPADFRGRLFLGYTEAADEIEVVAYNPRAGRYEFQLITDYCEACVPKLVYAKRAICLTCHQGEVPIFSVRPWAETNANPAVAARIQAEAGEHYFGQPYKVNLEQPEAIDNLTDQSAVLVAAQKVWLSGCGEGQQGAACRRAMLRHALAYISNPAALDDGAPALIQLQAQQWPESGIALAGNDLQSRNPFDAGLYEQSLLKQWRRLLFGEPERQASADKLAEFDKLPKLPAEFDPLVQRQPRKILLADSLDGVLGLALMFSDADRERLEAAAQYDESRLQAAVDLLPDVLFAPAALDRIRLMQEMLMVLEAPVPAWRFADVGALSPPRLDGEPPLQLSEASVLKPFERYCFACHRGNPSARLDFMAGPDEAIVLQRIAATESIRDALDWERYQGTRREGQLMPPADSWQREQLLRDLAALPDGQPDPLEQMREQVPSLFDF